VILSPRKSVTRFFIPLIDVLILLFAMFLIMPFVSGPEAPEAPEKKDKDKAETPLPSDVKVLQEMLKEERLRVARLEREKQARIADRLIVRVLEIDPTNGVLFYYDPGREEIRSKADAVRLITRQKILASQGGVVKDVFFLVLPPRRTPSGGVSPYPTKDQEAEIREWFSDVPIGFDKSGSTS
jgi:hypothetical protein